MNKLTCFCGSITHWTSSEIVDLSGEGPISTGIYIYTCMCGTRVPYAVWHRAEESDGRKTATPPNSASDAIALLREVFYARLPLGSRIDEVIFESDDLLHGRVHSFLEAQQHPC